MNPMTAPTKPDPAPSRSTVTGRDALRLLESVIEPVVETMGFSLCHLEWAGQPGRRTLRVFLDHERGVNLDDCARLNRIISNALDAAEVAPGSERLARLLAGAYTLEVS
jgi:ribosome maturation factor RimP